MLQDRPSGQGQTTKAVDNDETRARQSSAKTNENCNMSAPDIDELSIQPSTSEVRNLFLDSDSSLDFSSVSFSKRKKVKHDSYNSYIGDSSSGGNLATLFNTTDKIEDTHGIVLDNIQRDILKKSWRCDNPSKVSAYKDEYRLNFPVNESSSDFLQVPGLDDLVEPMLRKRHGCKSVKAWSKGKQLVTQPTFEIHRIPRLSGTNGKSLWHLSIILFTTRAWLSHEVFECP